MCTSLLLTAGAPILMLLSSEIGLAANNVSFIPSSMRPLMHLEKHAIPIEFYIERIANTRISISISAQNAELIATPDFYMYLLRGTKSDSCGAQCVY